MTVAPCEHWPLRVELDPEPRGWAAAASDHHSKLDDAARAFRAELGLSADRPVVMAGHQLAFWHAGILAKYLAAAALARASDLTAAWLWVDQDEHEFSAIRVPTRAADGRLRVAEWRIADPPADGLAVAACPAFQPRTFEGDAPALASVGEGIRRITAVLREHASARDAAHQLAAAVQALLAAVLPPGGPALDAGLSPGGPALHAGLSPGGPALDAGLSPGGPALRAGLPPGGPALRAGLSPGGPALDAGLSPGGPALHAGLPPGGPALRAGLSPGGPALRAGSARPPSASSSSSLGVFATSLSRTGLFRALVARMRMEPERCVRAYNEAVASVPHARLAPLHLDHPRGIELPLWSLPGSGGSRARVYSATLDAADPGALAPRAILMTGLLRLAGCDLFIHGTGGRAYEAVTERWFRDWLGVTLAPMAVATADLRLPLEAPCVTDADVARARWEAHRALHDPGILGDESAAGAKRAMIESIRAARAAGRDPLPFYREMHAELRTYREAHAAALGGLARRADRLEDDRLEAAIAADRTWPFPFHADAALCALADAIGARF